MGFATAALIVSGVGAVGSAVAQKRAAGAQKKQANLDNARSRREALRAMRQGQRSLEASGVASGTGGSSSQMGAMGALASGTADVIGAQGQKQMTANKISSANNMATGFGALQQVGSALATYNPNKG